jgi:hypothetical protein
MTDIRRIHTKEKSPEDFMAPADDLILFVVDGSGKRQEMSIRDTS